MAVVRGAVKMAAPMQAAERLAPCFCRCFTPSGANGATGSQPVVPLVRWAQNEENISDSEALKSWISIHECGAQIELGPCGPKQVILLTESGSRLAED